MRQTWKAAGVLVVTGAIGIAVGGCGGGSSGTTSGVTSRVVAAGASSATAPVTTSASTPPTPVDADVAKVEAALKAAGYTVTEDTATTGRFTKTFDVASPPADGAVPLMHMSFYETEAAAASDYADLSVALKNNPGRHRLRLRVTRVYDIERETDLTSQQSASFLKVVQTAEGAVR